MAHPGEGKRETNLFRARVAVELGEDPDWLFEIATEMEPEDGVIWVFGLNPKDKDGAMAFTPYGIECLRDFIREHRRSYFLRHRAGC